MQLELALLLIERQVSSGLSLVQALHHTELSRLGKKSAAAALVESLKRSAPKLSATELAQKLPPANVSVHVHKLKVKPARAMLAWPSALEVPFWAVHYEVTGVGWCAFFPAVRFTAVAETAGQLAEQAPRQLSSALQREGHLRDLASLLRLQHDQALSVAEAQISISLTPPSSETEEESVLEKVATALHTRPLPEAYEREEAVQRLSQELSGGRSVLLCGPSGVGKTAIFSELVRRREHLQFGSTPFFESSGSRLIAGQIAFGAWQARCQKFIAEVEKKKGIVHLGNLYELSQVARHSTDPLGMAGFFRPHLEAGRLVAVCECTPQQFELLEKEQPQLLQAFTVQDIEPVDAATCGRILRQVAPGLATATRDELLNLHARWTDPGNWPGRPLRFLRNLLVENERPDRDSVLAAFSRQTGIPRLILDEQKPLPVEWLRDWLGSRVRSQEVAVERVLERLLAVKAGLNRPGRPIATLLLLGPTGTGKTELARTLAEYLFSDRQKLTRLDMSEFSTAYAVSSLIGLPGHEKPGILTEKVREAPFQVVLFDEVEKAHPDFFDLLLQILGEGRLTDNHGQTADFSSSLVLMTSNLGADTFIKGGLGLRSSAPQAGFLEAVQAAFRPELLNRIDEIIPFAPLPQDTIRELASRELDRLQIRISALRPQISWRVADPALERLAELGYDRRYGARPLKRSLDRVLLQPLAEQLMRYPNQAALSVELFGNLRLQVSAPTDLRHAQAEWDRMSLLAQQISELRRKVQQIGKGPLVTDLRNEQARHRRQHRKTPGVLFPRQKLLDRFASLSEQVRQLEEHALFFLQQSEEAHSLQSEHVRLQEETRLCARELYYNSFERPHYALLALFSDHPRPLWALADAYVQLLPTTAQVRGLRLTVKKGASTLPTEEDPTPHLQRDWIALSSEKKPALGLVLEIRSENVFPLLRDESGLHWFCREHTFNGVLVHVGQEPIVSGDPEQPWKAPAFSPPADIHRRGATDHLPRLRTYFVDERRMEDPRCGKEFAWPASGLEVASLLQYWLDRRAEQACLL